MADIPLRGPAEGGRVQGRLPLLGLLSLLAMSGAGCSGDPGTGPLEVRWDRFSCDRCRMVLSDPKHSAQVRAVGEQGKSRVYFFDDIGCAVIWLEDQPFRDAPDTELWTTDWRSGEWIDARTAYYMLGQVTPMQYGLGAQPETSAGALTFAEAKQHVFEVERRFNTHRAHANPSGPGGSN